MVPKSSPFYMAHDNVTLECVIAGNPTPAVYWMWQQCSTANCSFDEGGWENITTCPNVYEIIYTDGNTTISIEAEVSAFFQCTGYNKMGNDSKHERFVATGKSFTFVKMIRVVFSHHGQNSTEVSMVVICSPIIRVMLLLATKLQLIC